jgi:predicted Rossmann fold nucleotide-binding protein DprA/Smf involved in DNA uptake
MRLAVFDCLSAAACTIDQIAFATRVPVKNILAILMEMELDGIITRLPGDRVARAA